MDTSKKITGQFILRAAADPDPHINTQGRRLALIVGIIAIPDEIDMEDAQYTLMSPDGTFFQIVAKTKLDDYLLKGHEAGSYLTMPIWRV